METIIVINCSDKHSDSMDKSVALLTFLIQFSAFILTCFRSVNQLFSWLPIRYIRFCKKQKFLAHDITIMKQLAKFPLVE